LILPRPRRHIVPPSCPQSSPAHAPPWRTHTTRADSTAFRAGEWSDATRRKSSGDRPLIANNPSTHHADEGGGLGFADSFDKTVYSLPHRVPASCIEQLLR